MQTVDPNLDSLTSLGDTCSQVWLPFRDVWMVPLQIHSPDVALNIGVPDRVLGPVLCFGVLFSF